MARLNHDTKDDPLPPAPCRSFASRHSRRRRGRQDPPRLRIGTYACAPLHTSDPFGARGGVVGELVDSDGSGDIDYDEFVSMARSSALGSELETPAGGPDPAVLRRKFRSVIRMIVLQRRIVERERIAASGRATAMPHGAHKTSFRTVLRHAKHARVAKQAAGRRAQSRSLLSWLRLSSLKAVLGGPKSEVGRARSEVRL